MKNQSPSNRADAISILTADHHRVQLLFKRFAKLHEDKNDRSAAQIAERICNELTVHASIEDEIFYPAVREAINDGDLINQAEVEHSSTSDLVAQIEKMSSSDRKFAAAVTVLGDYVNHHIAREEQTIFTQASKADIDLVALGKEITDRKRELWIELGVDEEKSS